MFNIANVKPAYQIKRLSGTVQRPVRRIVDGKITTEMRDEPAGYMIFFPQGTSMRVKSLDDLDERWGITENGAQLIDMETGEPFVLPSADLEREVERKTRRRGVVGITDVMADAE